MSIVNIINVAYRTKQDKTILQMAIEKELGPVVENLCQLGADVNGTDKDGNTPLLIALRSKQFDIASILVRRFC